MEINPKQPEGRPTMLVGPDAGSLVQSKVGAPQGDRQPLQHQFPSPEETDDGTPGTYGSFRKLFLQHWHETITYCAVFWSFGMCVAFLGPTLLDIGCLTSTDMKTISWVFFAQLLCSLIGASLSGYLVQRCDAHYMLIVNSTILPLCMFIIPFCKVLAALTVVLAVMGLNMGFIDCLANLQMINTYGEAVAPFLHALHFCYGMGAFISPMIAEPFLLNEDCTPFIDNDTSSSGSFLEPSGKLFINDSTLPAETLEEAQEMTQVKYAFWIMAAVQVPIACLAISLTFRMRSRGWRLGHYELRGSESNHSLSSNGVQPSNEYGSVTKTSLGGKTEKNGTGAAGGGGGGGGVGTQSEGGGLASSTGVGGGVGGEGGGGAGAGSTKPPPIPFASLKTQLMIITAATAALLFIYDGLQSTYGGYVYSYAVKSIVDLSKTEGAYLNALFWGMFAFGRLASIPLATRFTSAFMLLCNIMGCLLSMTFMLLLSHNHIVLYLGTAIFGMFLSSVAPTTISLAEQYIDITSSITSLLVVIAALGEMICPVVVGNMFVTLGPISFLVFGDALCFISVVVYCGLWITGRTTPKHLARQDGSFIWCRMCAIRKNPGQAPQVQHVKYLRKHESDSSNIEMSLVGSEKS